MCTVTESPSSVSSSLTLLSLPVSVLAPIVIITCPPSLRTMLGCSGAVVGKTAAASAASAVRRLPRKKRPVVIHGCCSSTEPVTELLPDAIELPEQYPRPSKRSRTGARSSTSSYRRPGGKKSVRICEASNQVHVLDACSRGDDGDNLDGDCRDSDDDSTTAIARWYQPSDYAQFRAAAIKQLSAWMSSNHRSESENDDDDKGSAPPLPRGLEPLYHRAVLQSSKQRQMYASLIVWKHRVLVHRRQQQQQQQQQQAEQQHDAKDSEGAPSSASTRAAEYVAVEDAVRELSEPLTEPDRIRAYRMAAMTTTAATTMTATTMTATTTASVVVRGSCSVERR
jgi:hypothetical protein